MEKQNLTDPSATINQFGHYETTIATVSDIEVLINLRVLMQTELYGAISLENEGIYRKKLHQYFVSALGSNYISFIAKANGIIVSANGVVFYQKPPSINGGDGFVGYVTNVYTLSEFRGRGIAGVLIQKLVEFSKARSVDRLHLGATNSGMNIYERAGFHGARFPQLELNF